MKKYLIDDHQVACIQAMVGSFPASKFSRAMESIKPIESLSDGDVWQLAREWFDNNDDHESLIKFGRAIERRILGGDEP